MLTRSLFTHTILAQYSINRYCDLPRDPHSPSQVGTEAAFCFFEKRPLIEDEFIPRHLDHSLLLRIVDTWAWVVVALELMAAYSVFGREGLFVAFTSGWLCQSMSLWFNIANHPDDTTTAKVCKASDGKADVSSTWYLPFYALDSLYHLFGIFVMEGEHAHHHDHAALAKRSKTDIAYWGFIKPLELLGLVWNVVVK
jgi:hypothetical protein